MDHKEINMVKKLVLAMSALLFSMMANAAVVGTWANLNPSNVAFSYTPAPADAIKYFNSNIANQSAANIESVIESQFGLASNALTHVAGCDSTVADCSNASATATSANGSTTNAFSSSIAFNYLAVHFGQAELLFYWDNPITSFTFTDLDGKNGFVKGLSNYRAYSDNVSSVPVPAAAWLLASGLGMFGIARRRINK
jgi:hypothetical protein